MQNTQKEILFFIHTFWTPMIDISEKIKKIITHFNLNNYSFSKRVGVTPTTIDSIVNGRLQPDGTRKKTKPGYDVLMAIVKEFQVNPEYLFAQEDNLLKENKTYDGIPKVVAVNSEGNENVVFVPAKARAGYLNGYGDTEFIESLPNFHMPQLTNGTYRCFEVQGDSMAPNFHNGDLIFGRYVEDLKDIKDGKVYVVISKEDGVVLKRVINRIEVSGKLILKSDNTNGSYPAYSINSQDIQEVWETKMFASKQIPEISDIENRLNNLESQLTELKESLR